MGLRKALISLLVALTACFGWAQQTNVISEIVVNGANGVSKDAILQVMRTKVGQPYSQSQLDVDRQVILSLGYFKAVDVRAIPLTAPNWQVVVDLVEFPKIKEIRIAGNDPKAVKLEEIMAVVTLKPGEIYNVGKGSETAKAIEALYVKKGYFARVEAIGPVDESPGTINISIVELRVNSLVIEGNNKTKDIILQRMIKTRPGDTFYLPRWRRDIRRLYDSQWFEKIDPTEREVDLGQLDLSVKLKEQRTAMLDLGVQVDPQSSFAGLVRYRDSNFKGSGQFFSAGLTQATSGGGASVDLDWANPYVDSKDTTLSVSAYSRVIYRFSNTFGNSSPTGSNYNERRTGGSFGVSRASKSDVVRLSANLRYETIKTSGINSSTSSTFIQQDGDVGVLSLAVTKDNRDTDIDPANGSFTRFSIEPGYSKITKIGGAFQDPAILGSNTFLRGTLESKWYYSPQGPRVKSLDEPRRVFATRFMVGAISGKVPFFEQFFVGGSTSLRGYADDRFWGKSMALISGEYRHPIQKSMNLIFFLDYGGAWGGYGSVADYTQSTKAALKVGYGVGISFKTPLGPIRMDLGFNDRGRSRTHFVISTSF